MAQKMAFSHLARQHLPVVPAKLLHQVRPLAPHFARHALVLLRNRRF